MIDDFTPSGPKRPDPQDINIQAEPDFRPPEATDKSYSVSEFSSETEPAMPVNSTPITPPKKDFSPVSKNAGKGKRKFTFPKLTKKQWIIVGVVATVLLLMIGGLIWKLTHKPKPVESVAVVEVKKEEKPKEFLSSLTGIKVSEADSKLPVTAVMIENSPDARPQAGLKDAGVVYEAVAEGGITRFLTLFQEAQPNYIGPVRSVRPYYLDWLVPFDAPVAHVGGSPEALAQIRNENIKDLDYSFNSNYYHRVSNRYAPHNVYTSRAELLELQKTKGWTTSKFTGWERKDDKPATKVDARSIDFSISGFLYNPHFDYDKATNTYKRSQAGKPHVDEKSGQQIAPKVVIAMIISKTIHPDGVHTIYGTAGSGKAFVFQDGTVSIGKWEKKDRTSPMTFKTASGEPLTLNRGNTWISAVELDGSVSYTP